MKITFRQDFFYHFIYLARRIMEAKGAIEGLLTKALLSARRTTILLHHLMPGFAAVSAAFLPIDHPEMNEL